MNFKYNIQTRELKKGKVYDVFFYEDTPTGRKQKRLCGFKTKRDAEFAYSAYMANSISKAKLEQNSSRIIYEDAWCVYFSSVSSTLKESTLYDFKHTAAAYSDIYFKERNLATLTKQDIIGYQDWLWAKKRPDGQYYSQKYLTKVYQQFTAFYRWCMVRYEVPDVLTGVPMPNRKTQKKEHQIWTKKEFEKFIDCVKFEKYNVLFTVLFYSGVRVGEAQALKISDYNGKELYVHATYTKKTIDGTPYKITETKNYKARRVPLPKYVCEMLDEWIANNPKNKFLFGEKNPPALNPIRYSLDHAIEEAGVKRIRIHDLRHSYVSMLLSKGVTFPTVAAIIGDTLEQVIKTYAHSIEEDKLKAVKLL